MSLTDLAARVERASGADHGLDVEIARLIRMVPDNMHPLPEWVLAYTSDLNAALGLVPRDFYMDLRGVNDSWTCNLNPTWQGSTGVFGAFAATPALAVVVAALRARASMENSDG